MRKAIAILSTLALLAVGGVAVADHQFPDVPNEGTFHADIDWLRTEGITFGYDNGLFGPQDDVSRGQMAAFMHRLYDRIQEDIPSADALAVDVVNEIEDNGVEIIGVEGPQGPAGEDGEDGATGPQGPAGVNEVITDSIGLGSSVATVTSIDLPAGNWMVAANATAEATGPQAPVCALVAGETVLAKVNPASEDELPTRVGVSLTAAVEGGGTVALACNEAANAFDATISAIGG